MSCQDVFSLSEQHVQAKHLNPARYQAMYEASIR